MPINQILSYLNINKREQKAMKQGENENIVQMREQLSMLKQQYNSLLQKNQNDLIKIKQKEKTFNEALQKMRAQKEQLHRKYKQQIDVLVLQIQKFKNNELTSETDSLKKIATTTNNDLKVQVKNVELQNSELHSIIDLNKERIQHLQENARKLMDENIDLTAQKQKVNATNQLLLNKQKQLLGIIQQLKSEVAITASKMNKITVDAWTEPEGDFTVSEKQHRNLISKFNQEIKNLHQSLEEQQKETAMIKNRLRQTNDELKRFIERDKKNNVIIKRKNQEIATIESELEVSRKKAPRARKLHTEEECLKCREWEQENKLLKQMVKSVQTMVRVKQKQVERYKGMNNSKLLQKSDRSEPTKKSRGQFPPLKKYN